jgi:DNA repair exonuclease SbcCD ATPase subunit
MCRKVADYQELTRSNSSKANPKLTALKVSLAQVEAEIDNLLESLKGANTTLLSYANKMIEELDGRKQLLCKQIADMSTETIAPNQIERISVYLDKWTDVSFDDKRVVIDGLITSIKAANGQLDINWKI